MKPTTSPYVFMVCCFMVVRNMLPSVVMSFRIGENHIMGGFITCAVHDDVIKSQKGISGTCNLHGEMVTLYNVGWCRSSSAVLSQIVIGHGKYLSCIGEAANMCMSSAVLDLSFCERSGTCSECCGWEKQSWM